MKNALERASNFHFVLMNSTIILLLIIFTTSYFYPKTSVSADLEIGWVSPNRSFKMCRFTPNIDLTPQFAFNTKQVFLYMIAKSSVGEEMVWSRIIKNGDLCRLEKQEQSNYVFSGGPGETILFELRGNVFPFVGKMTDVLYGSAEYRKK